MAEKDNVDVMLDVGSDVVAAGTGGYVGGKVGAAAVGTAAVIAAPGLVIAAPAVVGAAIIGGALAGGYGLCTLFQKVKNNFRNS